MIAIDGFTAIERIGQGGLGDVYRAVRSSTGSPVAIKVLRDVSDESVAWHRTRRELTALVALAGHAHVVQLIELLELADGPALVMEYAAGGSVAGLLRERGRPLSVGEVVLVGRHTAAALAAAHAQGIVHRDVKPQNLLIDAHGQVKLCDFGVAALTRSDDFRTRTRALSLRYASPEDLDDETEIGPPADVYSLGATLLHLARGAPPTIKQRLAPWAPPTTDDRDVAGLDAVVAACLHPEPEARPTAPALLERLDQLDWTLRERRRALPVPPDASGASPADADASAPAPRGPAGSGAAEPASTSVEIAATRDADAADAPETTAARDGRPEPEPPSADETPSRRRPPVVAGLVGLAVLAAMAGFLLQLGGDPPEPVDGAADAAATTASATPAGLTIQPRPDGLRPIDDPAVVWPFGDPGECLVQRRGVAELEPVDCDRPHDLQRYAVAELDRAAFPAGARYDAAALRATVVAACRTAFEAFVGVTPAASGFDTPFTLPSPATWAAGDRRYQCLLGVADRRLVGDAAGDAAGTAR